MKQELHISFFLLLSTLGFLAPGVLAAVNPSVIKSSRHHRHRGYHQTGKKFLLDENQKQNRLLMKGKKTQPPTPSATTPWPSTKPSSHSTSSPSFLPSSLPTFAPSSHPTSSPSLPPTSLPTFAPSSHHTSSPSLPPTSLPTFAPSLHHTLSPSFLPTSLPTFPPSSHPTLSPSFLPTSLPTFVPSSEHTSSPSFLPTSRPTLAPPSHHTSSPSFSPTSRPTLAPPSHHTLSPSFSSTSRPSLAPSNKPSDRPSSSQLPFPPPTKSPSVRISDDSSNQPSPKPSRSFRPSHFPSAVRSLTPTFAPFQLPSYVPTLPASDPPSYRPSSRPSDLTSLSPSHSPSISSAHSVPPSPSLSFMPSLSPSTIPSDRPYFPEKPSGSSTASPAASPPISFIPSISSHPSLDLLAFDTTIDQNGEPIHTCRRGALPSFGIERQESVFYQYSVSLTPNTDVGSAVSEAETKLMELLADELCKITTSPPDFLVHRIRSGGDAGAVRCASPGTSCMFEGTFQVQLYVREPSSGRRALTASRYLQDKLSEAIQFYFSSLIARLLPKLLESLDWLETVSAAAVSGASSAVTASPVSGGGNRLMGAAVVGCAAGFFIVVTLAVLGARRRAQKVEHRHYEEEMDLVDVYIDDEDSEVPTGKSHVGQNEAFSACDSFYTTGLGPHSQQDGGDDYAIGIQFVAPGTPSSGRCIEATLLELGPRPPISRKTPMVYDDTVDL